MKGIHRCVGIFYGCDGLITLICFTGVLPLLTVNAKSTLTLENMCKFHLSIIEAVQVGAIGVYSVYAMGYYATRQERVVADAETLIQAYDYGSVCWGLFVEEGGRQRRRRRPCFAAEYRIVSRKRRRGERGIAHGRAG